MQQYSDIEIDNLFEDLKVHQNHRNGNIRTFEDKIIKRIPRSNNATNIQKQKHPLNEFEFAQKIMKKQQEYKQSNRKDAENIVTMYDTIQTDKYYYIIMEKCQQSIQEEIYKFDSSIRGNQQQIVDCLYQIYKGYRFLQSINRDFIHRDSTLDNLLIQQVDGRIVLKIADFGISKLDETIIQTSNINKKTIFLAPEFIEYSSQKQGIQKYSNLVDIYSIGICLYFMMFGLKDIPEVGFQDMLNINNDNGNRLVNDIQKMTMYNQTDRMNWNQLQNIIIQYHVIIHSDKYYTQEIEQYTKQTFFKYTNLIVDYYKIKENGILVYKPFINDNQQYLKQFQKIDHFIQMINLDIENDFYILIQVLEAECNRDRQDTIQDIIDGKFKDLEFLQIKSYLLIILNRATKQLKKLTNQQEHLLIQDIKGRSSNPEYYNYYLNKQLKDVSEKSCCLIM